MAWFRAKAGPATASPLVYQGYLYVLSQNGGLLTCYNAQTGKEAYRERLPGAKSFYASPVAAAGRIYLVDRDGTTLVIKAADKLEVLATNKLGDPMDASPVLVGKQLFLRGEKFLYCIEEP